MNMQSLFRTLLLGSATTILFASCKKNEETTPPTPSELLTRSGWKLVKEEEKQNNGNWVDYTSTIPACEKDDIFLLKTDSKYEVNEGASKCAPGNPHIVQEGGWALVDNNTGIKFNKDFGTVYATEKIELLNESTLILVDTEVIGANTYYTKFTYGH